MSTDYYDKLVKKALMLETELVEDFLDGIDNPEIKEKLKYLLHDETKSTEFVLKTMGDMHDINPHLLQELEPGDQINQFIIVKLIAKGGMGSVFLAYDKKLKRNVAIKTIRSEFVNSKTSQKRFKQEAQILSQINHPNICQIYDYLDYEDGELLVLELVDGETLNDFGFDDEKMLDIFFQIVSALQIAHEKDVIHRDLKPDNIMLNQDGIVKILDFGIAKSKISNYDNVSKDFIPIKEKLENRNITIAGSLIGTLIYMSPEQAALEEITTASDMYSFGILMHLFLTNKSPYDIDDTEDLHNEDLHNKVINAQLDVSDRLPQQYTNLVNALTSQKPEERPTAHEVIESLNHIKHAPKKAKIKKIKLYYALAIFAIAVFTLWQYFQSQKQLQKNTIIGNIEKKINQLNQDVKNIYGLPLHDTTDDFVKIDASQDEFIEKINSYNILTESEKFFFIGKIYIATELYSKALPQLTTAWDRNIRNPELALELASIQSNQLFEDTATVLRKYGYLEPSEYKKLQDKYLPLIEKYLHYSNQFQNNKNSIPNAVIYWQEDNEEQALRVLDEVIASKDWSFRAYGLKASIIEDMALKLNRQGKNNKAYKMSMRALQVYEATKQRGRSYNYAYQGICQSEITLVIDSIERTGLSIDENYFNGLDNCKGLLVFFDSQVSDVYKSVVANVENGIAQLHFNYAIYNLQHGNEVLSYLEKAKIWNNKSLENTIKQRFYSTSQYIALIKARYYLSKGENPNHYIQQSFDAGVKALDKVATDYNQAIYVNLLSSITIKIQHAFERGLEVGELMEQAQNYYLKGKKETSFSKNNEQLLHLHIAKATLTTIKQQVSTANNPIENIQKVKQYIKAQQSIIKDEPYGYQILAELYLLEYLTKSNSNKKILEDALSNINQAISVYFENAEFHTVKAQILTKLAHASHSDYSTALKEFKISLKINPKNANTNYELARLYSLKVDLAEDNQSKSFAIENGIDACMKALKNNPNHSLSLFQKAKFIEQGIKANLLSKNQQETADKLYKKAMSINPLLRK